MYLNTEALVAAAKRSEFFPVSQTTFTDPDDLIAYANEEMMTKIVPELMSVRQDYFLSNKLVPILSNLGHYSIPERAIGGELKDLFYVPNTSMIQNRYPLPRRQVHDLASYASVGMAPSAFYLQSDEVVLSPTPGNISGTDSLLMYYFMRPSKLVPTSQCAKITGVSTVAGVTTFTVDTDLTALVSVGALLDFLTGRSPFRLPFIDVPLVAITATTIQVTSSLITDESGAIVPGVGDYICQAQTANMPMIPQEMHPILAECICFRALKALGAQAKLQVVAQNIRDMMQGALKLVSTRVESEPEVVYDRDGLLGATGQYNLQYVLR